VTGPAIELARRSRECYLLGWMPGTAGNLSVRTEQDVLITPSGVSKGDLDSTDPVLVDVQTSLPHSEGTRRPSAETCLHTALYRITGCSAVVHVHSPYATAASAQGANEGSLSFTGYELIKGFGLHNPDELVVPVLSNWTAVRRIAQDLETRLRHDGTGPPVLLIAGHGATAWGANLRQALDRVECLEALCQLALLTGSRSAPVAPTVDSIGTGAQP